ARGAGGRAGGRGPRPPGRRAGLPPVSHLPVPGTPRRRRQPVPLPLRRGGGGMDPRAGPGPPARPLPHPAAAGGRLGAREDRSDHPRRDRGGGAVCPRRAVPGTRRGHPECLSVATTGVGGERVAVRELTFGQAIKEALVEEMRRDPTVFIIGEDVAEAGTVFKVLSGLVDKFGRERVIDSPIIEAGVTGPGVGAAMTGMRPVGDIMFGDVITLAMYQ